MDQTPQNHALVTIAKGATAQLKEIIAHADRETAQPIYRELVRLASELKRKHHFGDKQNRTVSV